MLADVVGSDIRVELADGGEGNVTHNGVAELGGEDREVGSARGVIGTRYDLGKDFAAETGQVECVMATIGAGDDLPADDVEDANRDSVTIAHCVVARVLMEDAGEQPCA